MSLGTVQRMSELRCPGCGVGVVVPPGYHIVAEIRARGGMTVGIVIDGKVAHRCLLTRVRSRRSG